MQLTTILWIDLNMLRKRIVISIKYSVAIETCNKADSAAINEVKVSRN